jgi:RNA polymerase sigma factor (sigma-70 family)
MAGRRKEKALEAYLVAAARTGDKRALARLVQLRSPRLMAHAVRMLGEREGARDVVQDAWVEIMRGLGGLRDVGAFLPWALRIVSRRVARVIAHRQRDRRLAGEYAAESAADVPEAGPGAVDAARVRAAISRLPPEQGATIALFYLEDMSVAEVAMATDVAVGTVKTRLMHARAKLRRYLEGESDGKAG